MTAISNLWGFLVCLLATGADSQVCGSLSNYCSCVSSATMTATYTYQITPGNPMQLNICAINMCCNGCCGWVNSPLATGCAYFEHIYEYSHPGCPDISSATRFAPPSGSAYLGCWYAGYYGSGIADIPNGGNCSSFGKAWQNFLAPSACLAGTYGYGSACVACKTCSAKATTIGSCPAGSFADGITCTCNPGYVGDGVVCTPIGSLPAAPSSPAVPPLTTVIIKTLSASPTSTKLALSTSAAGHATTSKAAPATITKQPAPATTTRKAAASTSKPHATTSKPAGQTTTRKAAAATSKARSTSPRPATTPRKTAPPPSDSEPGKRGALGPRMYRPPLAA